jgi:hypothetical protein
MLGRMLWGALYVKAGFLAVLGLAAGLLYIRLSAGPLDVAGFSHQVAKSLADRLGPGWSVALNDAALQLEDGSPALRTAELAIRNPDGVPVVRAPYAIVSLDALSLLSGNLQPRLVELRDLHLRASINPDGSLSFVPGDDATAGQPPQGAAEAASASPKAPAAPGNEASQPSPLSLALASLFDLALERSSIVGAVDQARLTNARLTLVDAQQRERVGFNRVDARFVRTPTGARRFDVTLDGPRGAWRLNGEVEAAADGRRVGTIVAEAMPVEDALLLSGSTAFPGTTDVKLSGRIEASVSGGRIERLSGRVDASPGEVQIEDKDQPPIRVETASADASWNEAERTLALSDLSFTAGATRIRLQGALTATDQGWRAALSGRDGVLSGVSAQDAPVQLDHMEAKVAGGEGGGLVVERLALRGPTLDADLSGTLRTPADQGGINIAIRGTGVEARTALRLWPEAIAVPVRRFLGQNLHAGVAERVSIAVKMTANEIVKGASGGPIPDEAVRIDFALRGGELAVAEGLPPLSQANVSGAVTGTTASLQAPSARVQMADGRGLGVSEGSFVMANYWPKDTVARIAFRLEGGADALGSLLHAPLMRDIAQIDLDPSAMRGRADLRVSLPLTLKNLPPLQELPLSVTGGLSDLTINKVFGKERLENANLSLGYQSGGLAIRGGGRLAGGQATIDLRQPSGGAGEAVVSLTMDEAARTKKGLSFGSQLTGPLPVRVSLPLGKGTKGGPRVEADFSKAVVDNLLPGWTKAAGRPGRLAFTVADNGSGASELRDLMLDSGPVQLRGTVTLSTEGGLEKADLSSFKLSPGDDMRAQVERSGGAYRISVRGNVADARPILRGLTASSASAGAGGGKSQGDLDIDFAVNILTGHNDEVLTNASIKASTRNRELRQLQLTGRFRGASVNAQTARGARGAPVLTLQSEDAGALLRFADIYKRMIGGALALQATLGDKPQVGVVSVENFALRNEPALRRIAAEQPAAAVPAGSPASRLAGGEVPFTRLRAEFTRTASRIEFRDAVIAGMQVGFTLGGWLDYGRDQADIAGTFIPAYGLNNAFAQVPLVGPLLGGGTNEGLLAINFRVSGAATSPTLTVNPLSAVAPGFLRKLFLFGAGNPSDATSAAPPIQGER